jgi:hypothetical protein
VRCVIDGVHSGQGHRVLSLEDALPAVRERLTCALDGLEARGTRADAAVASVEAVRADLGRSTEAVKQSMRDSFAQLRAQIEEKELELLAQADAFAAQELKALDAKAASIAKDARSVAGFRGELTRHLQQTVGATSGESAALMRVVATAAIECYVSNKDAIDAVLRAPQPELASQRCFLSADSASESMQQLEECVQRLSGLHLLVAEVDDQAGAEDAAPLEADEEL